MAKLFIFLISCLVLSESFSLTFSINDQMQLVSKSGSSNKAENMDKISLKKKQISTFLESYAAQHGLSLDIDIRQKGNAIIITIFHQGKSNFFSDQKSYKSISKDKFIKLNENEIESILTKMIEEPDDYSHPGPNLKP